MSVMPLRVVTLSLLLFYHICVFATIYVYYAIFVRLPLREHFEQPIPSNRDVHETVSPYRLGCAGSFLLNVFGTSRVLQKLRDQLLDHYSSH